MLGLSDHYLFLFRGSLPSLVPFLNSLWDLIIDVYPSLRLQPNIACFWKLKMEWFVSYASISSFPMVWFSRIIHVLMVVAICDFTPHSEIILFLNLLQFSTLILMIFMVLVVSNCYFQNGAYICAPISSVLGVNWLQVTFAVGVLQGYLLASIAALSPTTC